MFIDVRKKTFTLDENEKKCLALIKKWLIKHGQQDVRDIKFYATGSRDLEYNGTLYGKPWHYQFQLDRSDYIAVYYHANYKTKKDLYKFTIIRK